MLSSLLLKKSSQPDPELDALFQASAPKRKRAAPQEPDRAKRAKNDDDGDSEGDPSTLVHESLADRPRNRGSKQKYVPPDETPAKKDQRTIFVGNLPLQAAQKRVSKISALPISASDVMQPLQKQLQRHILSFIPSAKIESTRFRSVPFNAPTSTLSPTTPPPQRDHDRTRASSWKTKESPPDPKPTDDSKQFLTPSQKKKIAFINHEFHSTADTVHAYIVFAYPVPPDSRPSNLPPLDPAMDPFIAAKEAVKKADGSLFLERIIRVDSVGEKPRLGDDQRAAEEADIPAPKDSDPKCTLFVGNLEFTSEEGDLRAFFESLLKTERGEPPTPAESTEHKPRTWVKRVRIIKDKETQLGKGFAYVQFIASLPSFQSRL
jgi:nucleolar protein 12